MLIKSKPRVAIVGATGAVGRELLTLMAERNFNFSELHLVASERSKGRIIECLGGHHAVESLDSFDFRKVDVAFFSAGTPLSKVWAKRAADQGALVIDNTNAFRMDPESPLVVPQVNAEVLAVKPKSGIIANPNCSTIQMVRVLEPIHRLYGLERVIVSTYQAASGGGNTGMTELQQDTVSVLRGTEAVRERFPQPLGFNVIPQVDVMMENSFTLEEQKMVVESRKILNLPQLDVTATAVRVPVMNGHSESVYLETKMSIDIEEIEEFLRKSTEMKVYSNGTYPTPRFATEKNLVHVGRLRKHPDRKNALWCWIVADNLRIGAALNAIQIAERVIEP